MLQAYKYSFLSSIRDREQLFWSLLFPILLGTFFHLAFGNLTGIQENFAPIPVALVNAENDHWITLNFSEMISALSTENDALLEVEYLTIEEAQEWLGQGKVDGIFQIDDEVRLIVAEEGINQSILQMVADQFLQRSHTMTNIAETQPELLEQVLAGIKSSTQVNQEITVGRGETNFLLNYFYALLAMVCFNGSGIGMKKAQAIQADISSLAVRRAISPAKKLEMILIDVLASVTVQFLTALVSIVYLIGILNVNVNFGEQLGLVILTTFIGCLVGISFGFFMATILKGDIKLREGILDGTTIIMYALSGLMIIDIRVVVRNQIPILDSLNPVTVLSDAFYSLSMDNTYERYLSLIIRLIIFTVFFLVVSAVVLRRERYENI